MSQTALLVPGTTRPTGSMVFSFASKLPLRNWKVVRMRPSSSSW